MGGLVGPAARRPKSFRELMGRFRDGRARFPLLQVLLQIVDVLPSQTTTVERCFSLLNRLKDKKRVALEEDSLQELMAVCSNGASLKEWSHADVVKAIYFLALLQILNLYINLNILHILLSVPAVLLFFFAPFCSSSLWCSALATRFWVLVPVWRLIFWEWFHCGEWQRENFSSPDIRFYLGQTLVLLDDTYGTTTGQEANFD